MNMRDDALNSKSAKALLFVNLGDNALIAKSAETLLFVIWETTLSMQRMWRRFCL